MIFEDYGSVLSLRSKRGLWELGSSTIQYHIGVIPAPRSCWGDDDVLMSSSPVQDGLDRTPGVVHVIEVAPVVACLTNGCVVGLEAEIRSFIQFILQHVASLCRDRSLISVVYFSLMRVSYLLDGPLVQRPLTGVQDRSSSFVQCFCHSHVALTTINSQLNHNNTTEITWRVTAKSNLI